MVRCADVCVTTAYAVNTSTRRPLDTSISSYLPKTAEEDHINCANLMCRVMQLKTWRRTGSAPLQTILSHWVVFEADPCVVARHEKGILTMVHADDSVSVGFDSVSQWLDYRLGARYEVESPRLWWLGGANSTGHGEGKV